MHYFCKKGLTLQLLYQVNCIHIGMLEIRFVDVEISTAAYLDEKTHFLSFLMIWYMLKFSKKGRRYFMDNNWLHSVPKELQSLFLEDLLQSSLVGINITDGEGRVLFLNDIHRKITGHDPRLYLGRTMKEIVEDNLISESATQIALEKKKTVFINQVSSHKNKYFQVKSVPLMNDKGEILYVLNYLLDASELIKLRDKLEKAEKNNERLITSNELLRQKLNQSGEIIYRSKKMERVVEMATRVAECDASVLITGPSGSGKEVIANLIHSYSRRSKGPFIKINCAAIPEQLLESELFGYEPGAFSGGNPKGKKGLIESAQDGTLLLDEIGELPLPLQSKLLRVLQTQKVRHIGSNKGIEVNFRLLAATNANLKEMIEEKTFREDLYYRLNVIDIVIPGLNERREDIVPLLNHFLDLNNEKYHAKKIFSNDALKFLAGCSYRGNVRELRNVVERMVIMSSEDEITLSDASIAFAAMNVNEQGLPVEAVETEDFIFGEGSLKEKVAAYERKLLQQYMAKYKSGAKVAEILQTDQSTISRKCKKYNIVGEV